METQDKQNIKKKAFAISTLMENPKLAQSIWDSWDSPVGSTRNTKAKSILYSMKRANNIQDGMGGPGTLFDQWSANSNLFSQAGSQQSNYIPPVQENNNVQRPESQSLLREKLRQEALSPEQKEVERQKIIRGVDAEIDWALSPTPTEGISRFQEDIIKGSKAIKSYPFKWKEMVKYALEPALSYVKYPFDVFGYGLSGVEQSMMEYTDPTKEYKAQYVEPDLPGRKKKYYQRAGELEVYEKGTNKHITEKMARRIPRFWDQVEIEYPSAKKTDRKVITVQGKEIYEDTGEMVKETTTPKTQEASNDFYKQMILSGQDPTSAAYEAKFQTGFDPDTTTIRKELEQDPKTNAEFGLNTIDGMTPEEIENWWNGLDNSEQDFWRNSYEASGTPMDIFTAAQEASDLGLTAEWFSQTYMRDKKKLAELLGIPEEQAHMLPEGMLSEQLADLRDSIKSEYRLDEQRDELYKLQQRDLDITDKFITYIHNKDEYLNEVSGLLDGAEKRIASMDTSNPYVAKRMQMYVNHLTILQGRQNQRYIDFLDTGVQHHKNQLDSLTLNINRDIALADEQWQEDKPKTEESWNNMKNMLEGIFNNITAREDRQFKLEEQEVWRTDAAEKSLNLVLQNAKLNAELFGGSTNIEVNASTAKMFTDMYLAEENDDGTLNFTTYNPYDVTEAANLAGQNSDYAMNAFMKDMGYTVSKSTGNGSLNQFEKFKESMAKNVASNVIDINNLSKEEQAEYNKMTEEEKASFQKFNDENLVNFNRMYSQLQINLQAGLKDYLGSTEEKIKVLREAINDLNYNYGFLGWRGLVGAEKKPTRKDFVSDNDQIMGKLTGALFDYTTNTLNGNQNLKGPEDVWGDIPDDLLPQVVSEKLSPYFML